MASWRQHPVLRRIPILLVIAIGLWLWRGSDAPRSRELVWLTGEGGASLRAVDIQIYDGVQLVKREQFQLPSGAGRDLTQKATLAPGTYDVRLFLERQSSPPEQVRQRLEIGDQDSVVLPLTGR